MAYEQAVQCRMLKVASTYTEKTDKLKYLEYADNFRMPYWSPFNPRGTATSSNGSMLVPGLSLIFCVKTLWITPVNAATA
jgi:hypothetical protein